MWGWGSLKNFRPPIPYTLKIFYSTRWSLLNILDPPSPTLQKYFTIWGMGVSKYFRPSVPIFKIFYPRGYLNILDPTPTLKIFYNTGWGSLKYFRPHPLYLKYFTIWGWGSLKYLDPLHFKNILQYGVGVSKIFRPPTPYTLKIFYTMGMGISKIFRPPIPYTYI